MNTKSLLLIVAITGVLVAAFALASSTAGAEPENLIYNGDFSLGSAGWYWSPLSGTDSKLQSMLSAGRPPIVRLVKGNLTHFVMVRSGSGSQPSGYQINDPWNGAVKRLSNYIDNGWALDSIREFARR